MLRVAQDDTGMEHGMIWQGLQQRRSPPFGKCEGWGTACSESPSGGESLRVKTDVNES